MFYANWENNKIYSNKCNYTVQAFRNVGNSARPSGHPPTAQSAENTLTFIPNIQASPQISHHVHQGLLSAYHLQHKWITIYIILLPIYL
jgi:hypothetical protein